MNRLELVQRLARECTVQEIPSTTVIGASTPDDTIRLINWVDDAWADIQTSRPDWLWMRRSSGQGNGASFVTVAGQARYALGNAAGTTGVTAATFGRWLPGTFRLYLTATGTNDEQELSDWDYEVWRDVWGEGANRSVTSRPDSIAVGPDKALYLGPAPLVGYTVTGDYLLKASAMAVNADEPTGLPAEHHMAIVFAAMMSYGEIEVAQEVYSRGLRGYRRHMSQLEIDYLPGLAVAGSL